MWIYYIGKIAYGGSLDWHGLIWGYVWSVRVDNRVINRVVALKTPTVKCRAGILRHSDRRVHVPIRGSESQSRTTLAIKMNVYDRDRRPSRYLGYRRMPPEAGAERCRYCVGEIWPVDGF